MLSQDAAQKSWVLLLKAVDESQVCTIPIHRRNPRWHNMQSSRHLLVILGQNGGILKLTNIWVYPKTECTQKWSVPYKNSYFHRKRWNRAVGFEGTTSTSFLDKATWCHMFPCPPIVRIVLRRNHGIHSLVQLCHSLHFWQKRTHRSSSTGVD